MTISVRTLASTAATLLAAGLAIGSAVPANAAAATDAAGTAATASSVPTSTSAPVATSTEIEGGRTFLTGTGIPRATLTVRPVGGGAGKLASIAASGSWRVDITSIAGRLLEMKQSSGGVGSAWVPVGDGSSPVTPPVDHELTVTGLVTTEDGPVLRGTGTPSSVLLVRGARSYNVIARVADDGRWTVAVAADHAARIDVEQRTDGITTGTVSFTAGI